jgi:hypothetical protein
LDPNAQQTLDDYKNGSSKTTAFIKSQIVSDLSPRKEVTEKEILREVQKRGVLPARQDEVVRAVASELTQKRIRVWR